MVTFQALYNKVQERFSPKAEVKVMGGTTRISIKQSPDAAFTIIEVFSNGGGSLRLYGKLLKENNHEVKSIGPVAAYSDEDIDYFLLLVERNFRLS